MIVLANTMPKEQCVDFASGIGIAGTECVTSTNAPLAWGGLAAAGLGTGLTIAGFHK